MAELFDMAGDRWQMRNVIDNPEYADIARKLKQSIADWDATTDHAPMIPIGRNPGVTSRSKRTRTPLRPSRERP